MNYQRSFTLLETIVAIYVLLAGIVGAMNLTQQNIGAITLFRHQLIAANLAQEGAELIRAKRDSNYLECYRDAACYDRFPDDGLQGLSHNPNMGFMNGITDGTARCNTLNECYIEDPRGDPITGAITFLECPAGDCPYLLLDESTGFYQYDDGDPTIFKRRIWVTELTQPRDSGLRDWEIHSRVEWQEKLNLKHVEVIDVLTPHGHK